MVMDAVREPDALQVHHERAKIGGVAVARVVLEDFLERALDREVVAVLLVEDDLAAAERSLVQIVEERFGLAVEAVEARNSVAQHRNVREALRLEVERLGVTALRG